VIPLDTGPLNKNGPQHLANFVNVMSYALHDFVSGPWQPWVDENKHWE
jgi:hypothetical protein